MLQTHFHQLRPLTTAHLAQTMTLLSLTIDELQQQIEGELASNPALELVEENRCPTCHRLLYEKGVCPVCSRPLSGASDEPVVFVTTRDEFYAKIGDSSAEVPEENYSSTAENLPAYVLRQIGPELEIEERRIVAYILTHLDEDGILSIPLAEVALYFHVPLSNILELQRIIQHAEPIGVGSNSPRQALLVQLDVLEEAKPIPKYSRIIIQELMDFLSHRQYVEIARKLKAPLKQIQEACKFIGDNLNPFPGRSHWGDNRQSNISYSQVYSRPDILIGHLNDDPKNPLLIEIILPIGGTLRLNPLFRKAIQEARGDMRDAWRSDYDRGSLFIKCLQQRNHTMRRLMQRLVGLQKQFILSGEKYMKSVTRVQLAKELEVHESTISRAVSGKTVQLPNRRIVALSSFFDRSLNVRTVLRELISQESHPFSDGELVVILAKQGYSIARRTVAKYRAMEGILPAHLRHLSTRNL